MMSMLEMSVDLENITSNATIPTPAKQAYLSLEEFKPSIPKVLSIDDNEVCQKVNCTQLKKLGCFVESAVTAKEAFEKIEIRYEIIFTELYLFGFSGKVLIDFIRYNDRSANKKTPIIAVSSWFEPYFVDNYNSMGIDYILIKPILLQDFKNIIQRYTVIKTGVVGF